MQGEDAGRKVAAQEALYTALEAGLRVLHPMMPFITEELWQRLPRRAGTPATPSIMLAPYPTAEWCNCRCAARAARTFSATCHSRLSATCHLLYYSLPPVTRFRFSNQRVKVVSCFSSEQAFSFNLYNQILRLAIQEVSSL